MAITITHWAVSDADSWNAAAGQFARLYRRLERVATECLDSEKSRASHRLLAKAKAFRAETKPTADRGTA